MPADLGPAHMPMTPDTDSRPRSASLVKYWSSRSAMLPVISLVMSTASLVLTLRRCRSSMPWASRSPGRRDPSFGGISVSSGPRIAPILASLAS